VRSTLIALGTAAVLLTGAGALASGGPAAQAAAAQGSGGVRPPRGVVSASPARGTPHLSATADSPVQQIRQLAQCGNTMYAVGSFSRILHGSASYRRTDIVSFKATAPYPVWSFAPRVVGSDGTTASSSDAINTIAFSRGCADVYIGGDFSSVNGVAVRNIAEISTRAGRVVTGFRHDANRPVQTLIATRGHLLAGGNFTSISGSAADAYLASLNPRTGRNDGFARLGIHGNYQFPGVSSNATRVYNQALSHSGRYDLVMGDFTSAGGRHRQQIFMLDLTGRSARLTDWTSPQFNGNCATVEPYYVQAAAWSSRDGEIYLGTTGYHPYNQPIGHYPRTGLCDAAAAFPAARRSVAASWINYTGCDSLYAVATDASAAYFAGHERWSMNPRGCDFPGPGAYSAPGLEGLAPRTGRLYLNSSGSAGYYRRARGLGADDMLRTRAGLWVAGDNFDGSQMCGGAAKLAGICFLPDR